MITSDTLPQQALEYLNKIEESKNKEAEATGRIGARAELLKWANDWYTTARTWRKQSYEDDWIKWQRASDGRYDPQIKAQKKDWQATAFVDLTPTHRETIHAELFRLVAGSRPLLDVTAGPGGDAEQADNIRDLIVREFEKSRFEVEYNKNIEDKTTYGSGFSRIWFENDLQDRIVKVPVQEPLNSPQAMWRAVNGQRATIGYQMATKQQLVYRGVRIRNVPIWDFFPDPKALQIKGHACAVRSFITLQYILDQVTSGEFMPEAAQVMSQQATAETTPPDKSVLQLERGISDVSPRREGNQKAWESYELFGRLPQKWVYPLLKEPVPVDNAEKLVPARVIFNAQTVFCVYLSESYDGEPPVYKDDYFPVPGRFYGRGIPESLKNCQMVVNEVVNQRLDEGNLALQEGFAVIEKAIANPEDLESGGPGLIVRMNAKALGPNGDVRAAILPLGRPDVKINAGFTEVHEWERMAEGRTGANRVVVGDATRFQGANRTLGGQQMLKQTAGERFAFLAMLSEFTYMYQIFRAYWEQIYRNLQPQDVVNALGQERAARFQLMSPEDVETSYRFTPKGIFEREAKAEKHGRLAALWDQFKGMQGLDPMKFFDLEAKSFEVDPESLKVPQAEMLNMQAMAHQMAEPMAKQMLQEIILGMAAKDVERNLAEKVADEVDGAKQEEVGGVTDLAKKKEPKGKI